jgi:phosphatidate cytidylyltransferase
VPVDEPAGPAAPGEDSTAGGPGAGEADRRRPGEENGPRPPQPDSQAYPQAKSQELPEANGQGSPEPTQPDGQPGGAAPAGGAPGARAPVRAGRNLPAALGVGLGLGGLALVTLFTVKATFLVYLAAAIGTALWELSRAFGARDIRLPLVPVAAGGAAALVLAYWQGERALVACLALTVIAILAWRLPGGVAGYLRDVMAGTFVLAYLPLMGGFVALMLAAPDGARRVLIFLILAVCSDIGGYFVGILLGRHLMVPRISPKKTWEGFAGSALACLVAGGLALSLLLHGAVWQGVLLGAAAVLAATLGDLAASMSKRDLGIKDWGALLPGHGGVLDRIDSLVVAAPVVWLLLLVFVPVTARH